MSRSLTIIGDVLLTTHLGAEVSHIEISEQDANRRRPLSELLNSVFNDRPKPCCGEPYLGLLKITIEEVKHPEEKPPCN